MKRTVCISLVALIAVFLTSPLQGATYYVSGKDKNAKNTNDGLSPVKTGRSGPWKTLEMAFRTVKAGDTLYIREGVYSAANLTFSHSGAAGRPIIVRAYKGEKAVIDGKGKKGPGIRIQPGQSYFTIQGLVIQNMSSSGIATDDGTNVPFKEIHIKDCVLQNNGWSGIELAAAKGFSIEKVTARGNVYHGVDILGSKDGFISSSNGRIKNSVFSHQTGDEGHGLGINQGNNIVIEHCRANHNRIHGFDVSDWPKKAPFSHHITMDRNLSWDNGKAGFAVNSDSYDIRFTRNIAWGNGAKWAGLREAPAFWVYEGAGRVTYFHNVAYNNRGPGFGVEGSPGEYGGTREGVLVYGNNIAQGNGNPKWEERLGLSVEGGDWKLELYNNNWGLPPESSWPVVRIEAGRFKGVYTPDAVHRLGENTLAVDPGFANAKKGDFRLSRDSPMRDAGRDVGMKYCGPKPDLGAFEICN